MKYLILGASAAGINAAKTIRSLDKNGEITIISEDTMVYSRCMLHTFIAGHRDEKGIDFIKPDFFEKLNIKWLKGKKVTDVDTVNKEICLLDGTVLPYDKLLIATGASSFMPPIEGIKDAKSIYGLRNIEDAISIKNAAETVKAAVVIGAGLVGIDTVIGLLDKKIKLYIIELSDRIMPMQLDKKASLKYEEALQKRGVVIHAGKSVKEVIKAGNGNVKSVILNDGTEIECGMVVVAAGVRPNIGFIKNKAVETSRGIVINDKCETTAKDVYAAGDVTAIAPVWSVAVKQGITAGYNMTGFGKTVDDSYGMKNSMNFLGINTVSIGVVEPEDDTYTVQLQIGKDSYKKIIHKDGIIYGAIVQGDISYCGFLYQIIKNRIDISKIEKSIFDIDFSDFFSMRENGMFEYKAV